MTNTNTLKGISEHEAFDSVFDYWYKDKFETVDEELLSDIKKVFEEIRLICNYQVNSNKSYYITIPIVIIITFLYFGKYFNYSVDGYAGSFQAYIYIFQIISYNIPI